MKSAKKWLRGRGRSRSKSNDTDDADAEPVEGGEDEEPPASQENDDGDDEQPSEAAPATSTASKSHHGGGGKDWKAKYKAAKKQIKALESRNAVLMQMVIDARLEAARNATLHHRAQGKYDAIRYELARKNVGIEDDSCDEGGSAFAELDANDIAEELGRGMGTDAGGGGGGGADGVAPDARPETR